MSRPLARLGSALSNHLNDRMEQVSALSCPRVEQSRVGGVGRSELQTTELLARLWPEMRSNFHNKLFFKLEMIGPHLRTRSYAYHEMATKSVMPACLPWFDSIYSCASRLQT